MRIRIRDDHGAVLVLAAAAIGFVFIPALVAYVIDLSSAWTHKRHLQLQADAAAFAGGDLFSVCFTVGTDSAMRTQADKYVGVSSSPYNKQIGGTNQGSISRLYNSKTYPPPQPPTAPPPDDTIEGDSCVSKQFDVKVSEANLPFFFGSFMPAPHTISAHARVGLFKTQVGNGSRPFGVPDYNPSHVFVTLWNMTTGAKIGDYDLPGPPTQGGTQANPLNVWTGTVPGSAMPDLSVNGGNNTIGMRVGVGNSFGTCYPPDPAGNGGSQYGYTCYDNNGQTPLVVLHGSQTGGGNYVPATGFNSPVLQSLTETCNLMGPASPFFSELISPSTTCPGTVTAVVNYGTCPAGYQPCTFTAQATDGKNETIASTVTSNSGLVTHTFTFSGTGGNPKYDLADGQEPVSVRPVSWEISKNPPTFQCGGTTGIPCKGNFGAPTPVCGSQPASFLPCTPTFNGIPLHQAAYSADRDLDASGPVEAVTIEQSGTGAPLYSSVANAWPDLTVRVALVGNFGALQLPRPPGTVDIIRLLSKNSVDGGNSSRSSVVQCDGATGDIVKAIKFGCQTPYQINTVGICPHIPGPDPPADCVPVQTGNLGQTIMNALGKAPDGLLASCPQVNYPSYSTDPPDPRIMQVMVTDFSALLNNQGSGLVPVTNFATFYITGWGRFVGNGNGNAGKNNSWKVDCKNINDPVPASLSQSANTGAVAIWGHFIQYVNPSNRGGTDPCPATPPDVNPCVPALTR